MNQIKAWLQTAKISTQVRGDTILEVVIATAIMSSIMIATFNILQRALDTNVNVKNRIIALNIAREGTEAVRNIRDTNWLKYSGERRDKWLCMDEKLLNPATDDPTCEGNITDADIINNNDLNTPVFYTVDFDTDDDRFYLNRESLQSFIDFEVAQAGRENYRLYSEISGFSQFYTHRSTGNNETIFYRQIQLTILNPYESDDLAAGDIPTVCRAANDTDETCIKGRLNVVSRVFWQEEGRTRSITLETNLFDFFERDAY